MKTNYYLLFLLFEVLIASSCADTTRELHVSKSGNDNNKGSLRSPLLSISAASESALPGDVITVHEGVYREYINPTIGGNSESERIIYRAAPGENVTIKGSEQITSWVKIDSSVWNVEIPDSFFNDFNPYRLKIGWVSEDWLRGGEWTHCGDVYLNGEAFYEKRSLDEVKQNTHSWCTESDSIHSFITIYANFGESDPNKELSEINVRESIFYPADSAVNFITLRGFTIMHSANGWGPPAHYQGGAIGTNGGHHWTIENCEVINAKTNGFSMGIPRTSSKTRVREYDNIGHHLIKNNIFRRCGQSAIVGNNYNTASHILGNYIAETAYRNEFWGAEPAAIKFHQAIDLIVENNNIARSNKVLGLWIDFGNQNIRVTRNYFGARFYMEMNHGPVLIDNNIFDCSYTNWVTEGVTIVHNLLNISNYRYVTDSREPGYFIPHTLTRKEEVKSTFRDERWYNNIFTLRGLDSLTVEEYSSPSPGPVLVPRVYLDLGMHPLTSYPGCASDFNLFLNGSKPSPLDQNSIVSDFNPELKNHDEDGNVRVEFLFKNDGKSISGPFISTDFLGVSEISRQRTENPDGTPIQIDHDILGKPRNTSNPGVGPFSELKEGLNVFTIYTLDDKGPKGIVK